MTTSGGEQHARWPQPEARYPDQTAGETAAGPDGDQALPIKVAAARRKKPKNRIRSRHERADRRAGVPVKPISVSVPASTAAAWREHSQRVKRSLVDVLLDAIPSTVVDGQRTADKARLSDIVRAHQAASRVGRQATSDGLFLRTPAPGESDIAAEDPFVTVPLRMLSTNVDILDALAYDTASESRSQLVVAALNAHLADAQAEYEARIAASRGTQETLLPTS